MPVSLAAQSLSFHGAGPESEAADRIYTATQWQLMWWRFRRHKLALISTVVLIAFYLMGALCEFVAPHDPHRYDVKMVLAPPQRIRFVDERGFHLRPYVYGITSRRNMETLRVEFEVDTDAVYPLYLFVRGDPYKFWGLWKTDVHLFGIRPEKPTMLFLLGADEQGRDVLSRIVYGSRISLSIGLVGVALSLVLGVLIGGISGYFGGVVDTFIQRVIEFLRSIPGIPLWMTLAAALPRDWTPVRLYFGITVILSLLGWTRPGARRARAISRFARGGLCPGSAPVRGRRDAHHRVPHGPVVHQPPDRQSDAFDPQHDPERDLAELSRIGVAASDRELGCVAAGGAEPAFRHTRALDVSAWPGRGHRRARF